MSRAAEPSANAGKELSIAVDGVEYHRIPIKTPLVVRGDDLVAVVTAAAKPELRPGDVLFVTEKIVGITQGRSYPIEDIEPRKLAVTLSGYVQKTPHGIGLGMPETMEMALRECGTVRILFAAAVAAVTKKLGRKGDFYRIAGPKARGIDGPTEGTIPPYDSQVVLAPAQPKKVAAQLSAALGGVDVAIVDINDLGGNILGSTLGSKRDTALVRILQDNPLGQGTQSTPMGIVRVS
ncbi:coenzyme F420-0:L-glutamate ligase [Humibacter sp. RRB41]|uniref:coenzyme F420-0:L-glutamate ligase n=1 Tax=Humibacter sp. RRB41 TaxID=2919946 RepID=UPI001FAB1266|nr:coenzyme F420-0:L-glutamate ligase [Humibacter sp. RRB41]